MTISESSFNKYYVPKIKDSFKSGNRIFNVGCAPGVDSMAIKYLYNNFVSIDINVFAPEFIFSKECPYKDDIISYREMEKKFPKCNYIVVKEKFDEKVGFYYSKTEQANFFDRDWKMIMKSNKIIAFIKYDCNLEKIYDLRRGLGSATFTNAVILKTRKDTKIYHRLMKQVRKHFLTKKNKIDIEEELTDYLNILKTILVKCKITLEDLKNMIML
jgi:hypothetical protein